jgi:undecaprenyl-diphosphatase
VATILERLGAGDRALFARWVLEQSATRRVTVTWEAVTHLGSAWCTIAVCLVPLLTDALSIAGRLPLEMLVVSHLVIQALKRTIGRARPSYWHVGAALVEAPDRFSFPSGHAASAMSVAFGFAHAFPDFAAPLVMLAVLVGLSRVVVGVHYPSDVLVGQLIAVATGVAIIRIG